MCSGARRFTGTSSHWGTVNAADTRTCSCWPQNDKTLLPSKQHCCQILPTYCCWDPASLDAVFSNTLWAAWLPNRDPSGTHTPSMLPVLLCSAAAEGEWWSGSLGGVPWPGAGHVLGMRVILQDWGCLSTVEKQTKWKRERRRGKHWAELPGKCCCGQFAWTPQGLLMAALIFSPWDPGMICCHMHWAHCFLSKKKSWYI